MFTVKRIYEAPEKADGVRILVDRLWPRGLSKEKAKIVVWMKDIAPSDELRKWFGHRADRWHEFKRRYFVELKTKGDLIEQLERMRRETTVSLLYAARDDDRNQAVALREFMKRRRGK